MHRLESIKNCNIVILSLLFKRTQQSIIDIDGREGQEFLAEFHIPFEWRKERSREKSA